MVFIVAFCLFGFVLLVWTIIATPSAYRKANNQKRIEAENELLRIRKLYDEGVIDMAEWQKRKREQERILGK